VFTRTEEQRNIYKKQKNRSGIKERQRRSYYKTEEQIRSVKKNGRTNRENCDRRSWMSEDK
jgi:hypothetical protein